MEEAQQNHSRHRAKAAPPSWLAPLGALSESCVSSCLRCRLDFAAPPSVQLRKCFVCCMSLCPFSCPSICAHTSAPLPLWVSLCQYGPISGLFSQATLWEQLRSMVVSLLFDQVFFGKISCCSHGVVVVDIYGDVSLHRMLDTHLVQ